MDRQDEILEHLSCIRASADEATNAIFDGIEGHTVGLIAQTATLVARLDRVDARLDRIQQRLAA
jgi:hypothetical protein